MFSSFKKLFSLPRLLFTLAFFGLFFVVVFSVDTSSVSQVDFNFRQAGFFDGKPLLSGGEGVSGDFNLVGALGVLAEKEK